MSRNEQLAYIAFMIVVLLMAALTLSGCATDGQTRLEPEVRTVEVKVPTPVPCPALERLGPEPTYPDTDAAIQSAETIGDLAALYAAGRKLRVQRLSEYLAAKTSCIF